VSAAPRRVTPESLVAAFVVAGAAMMAFGYLLDAAGLPMTPAVLAAVAATAAVASFLAVRDPAPAPPGSVTGFAVVVAAFLAYLMWLASPALLPITDGPDVVHHLQLVHFIETTHRLPHDPALRPFLAEMADYTPGSHIVAAMAGEWLGVDPLRVLFPATALFVAVKAGVVYALAVRALAAARGAALLALAAPILLLVPAGYTLGSFFKFYFLAQVVAETFAMAMLLAAIGWARTWERPRDGNASVRNRYLWMTAASGVGVILSWPVWIVPVGAAVAAAILLTRAPRWRAQAHAAVVVFAPPAAFALWHALAHPSGTSILGSSGLVLQPSAGGIGPVFVVLAVLGAVFAAFESAGRPIAVLLLASVAAALAMAPLAAPSYYLPLKFVYLAVPPAAVLGAFALAIGAERFARSVRVGGVGRAAPLICLGIAVALALGRVPAKRQTGHLTEASLAAGLWARGVLPPACVDYFSRHWLTGYWLHLDVLGNPRDSDRMRAETFEFHDAVSRWIEGRGLPYAIVEDVSAIPREIRADMTVLHAFPPAAVVKNLRSGSDPKFGLCAVK
jgi:hypothetical protein